MFYSHLFAQTRQQLLELQSEKFQASWDVTRMKSRLIFTQYYQDNWMQGGTDAFTYDVSFDNMFFRKGRWIKWDNTYKIQHAQLNIGKEGRKITKNSVDISTDFILQRWEFINPFIGIRIITNLTDWYKYPAGKPKYAVSAFWDPVTITYKVTGLDFNLIKDLKFEVSMSFTEKRGNKYLKGIDDEDTKDIVEKKKITKGMTSRMIYQRKFGTRFDLKSQLDLGYGFGHYSTTVATWNTDFDIKLIKFLSFSIDAKFKYDKSQSKRGQLLQVSGISIVYDFSEILKNNNSEEPDESYRTGLYIYDIDKIWSRQLALSSTDGALVWEVEENSPAEKANLKKGEVITEVNGESVKNVEDVLKCFTKADPKPGKEMNLTVLRNGLSYETVIILEEPPKKK